MCSCINGCEMCEDTLDSLRSHIKELEEENKDLMSVANLYQTECGEYSEQVQHLLTRIEELEKRSLYAEKLAVEVTDKHAALVEAARGVIERWDTPLWKDVPATAIYISKLRAALEIEK